MKKVISAMLAAGLLLGAGTGLTARAEIVSVKDGTLFGAPTYAGMENYSSDDVAEVIGKVWKYYTDYYYTDTWNWEEATFHLGGLEAYKATGNETYYDHTYRYAEGYSWKCNDGNNTTYLDDIASSMVYCVLHSLAPADYKLEGVRSAFDYTYNHGMLDYSWVDEIYMVGLAQTYLAQATGNSKYSEIDLDSYLFYREHFFDTEDMLWYRDGKYVYDSDNPLGKSTNGEKVFWGRGNAWVYVSLAQRMEYMDHDDPAYEIYKNDFLMMSEGLRRVRREDGVWNPNLGDANEYSGKEMTGTGGFIYGMALGVRLGLLDADVYVPVLQKAYDTVVGECIREDGRLGFCQPVGWQPDGYSSEEAMKNSTNSFGVGLQLMGLSQFMRLCSDYVEPTLHTQNQPFDDTKDIYTIEDGWYKGIMVASTNATNIESGNGVQNLVNGVWSRDNTGSRFTAFGLKTGAITVTLTLAEEATFGRAIINPYNYRAYKYTLELWNGNEWICVADTTTADKKIEKSFLNKWEFDGVTCTQVRFTGYGCWNENTDALSIRELLLYEV